MKSTVILMSLLFINTSMVGADEAGASRIQLEEVAPGALERGQDVDEVITNPLLRAQSGAAAKYSLSTVWHYNGGTVAQPGSRSRPNIITGSNVPTLSGLSGGIAGKYSVSTTDSINAGVALRMFTPFHQSPWENRVTDADGMEMRRRDVYDPYLTYQTLFRIGILQNRLSFKGTLYTDDFSRQRGYVANSGVEHTLIQEVGMTGLSLGLSSNFYVYYFDKFDEVAKSRSANYGVGLFPLLEYKINDKLNFRTLVGQIYEQSRSEERFWTWRRTAIYQSMGLGVSVTRDVYIYPNIQFLPGNIDSDLTNVAVSAYINIF